MGETSRFEFPNCVLKGRSLPHPSPCLRPFVCHLHLQSRPCPGQQHALIALAARMLSSLEVAPPILRWVLCYLHLLLITVTMGRDISMAIATHYVPRLLGQYLPWTQLIQVPYEGIQDVRGCDHLSVSSFLFIGSPSCLPLHDPIKSNC